MTHTANQTRYITENETRNAVVSFDDRLETGESLTGTPTVTCTGLTLENKAVNTSTVTVEGETIAVGRAVQFTVSGATADTRYTITISCTTDATPAQTLEGFVLLVGV